jgi:hypothetical protein
MLTQFASTHWEQQSMTKALSEDQKIYFRDLFRDARSVALKDAEGFDATFFALERFGRFLLESEGNLGKYKEDISDKAKDSPLAGEIPIAWPDFHTRFNDLYDQLQVARNSAFHEGAVARHITSHAVLLSMILEDALMKNRHRIGDFMVRMPACACMWHPLSFIRQTLLANSFSYLPVNNGTEAEPDWKLISDCALAGFLRAGGDSERKKRLSMTLRDALKSGISLIPPYICHSDTTVQEVITSCEHHPVLIVSADNKQLLGIATAFDVL